MDDTKCQEIIKASTRIAEENKQAISAIIRALDGMDTNRAMRLLRLCEGHVMKLSVVNAQGLDRIDL